MRNILPIAAGCLLLLALEVRAVVTTVRFLAANLTIGSLESLEVCAGDADVTHIVVSSCGGHCFEVRIEHDAAVPTMPTTWGAVKARFD